MRRAQVVVLDGQPPQRFGFCTGPTSQTLLFSVPAKANAFLYILCLQPSVDVRVLPRRCSKRLNGDKPDYVEIDEHDRVHYEDVDELVDLMGASAVCCAVARRTLDML